ncbi:MAG: type II toxin-antitoxin system VapC family toxin [Methanobacteriota archaeon]|nr:MAG: type II toxin-antitoxin system VapC family toxin [Euryarchaeota archaeon]
MKLLLDTNAVIKRYVAERGSDVIETVYRSADAGRIQLVYSLWTLGEGLGVLDRLDRQGRLPPGGLSKGRRALLGESARLARLGVLTISPLGAKLVRNAWSLLLRHHIYQADAVQIATGLARKVDILLTADHQVARAAAAEGLRVLDPERQSVEIAKSLAA